MEDNAVKNICGGTRLEFTMFEQTSEYLWAFFLFMSF